MYREYLLESINEILQNLDETKLKIILTIIDGYDEKENRP